MAALGLFSESMRNQLAEALAASAQKLDDRRYDCLAAERLCNPEDVGPRPHRYMLAWALGRDSEPSVKLVKSIISHDESCLTDGYGDYLVTPLFVALCKNWAKLAHFLIDHPKTNLKIVNKFGETLLYAACGVSGIQHEESFKGSNIDLVAHLLHVYRKIHGTEATKTLVCYRAKCGHGAAKAGFSVLHRLFDARRNRAGGDDTNDLVRLLISKGADLSTQVRRCQDCGSGELSSQSILARAIVQTDCEFLAAVSAAQLCDTVCDEEGTPALLFAVRDAKAWPRVVKLLCNSRITAPVDALKFMQDHAHTLGIMEAGADPYDDDDDDDNDQSTVKNAICQLFTRIVDEHNQHMTRVASHKQHIDMERELLAVNKALNEHYRQRVAEIEKLRKANEDLAKALEETKELLADALEKAKREESSLRKTLGQRDEEIATMGNLIDKYAKDLMTATRIMSTNGTEVGALTCQLYESKELLKRTDETVEALEKKIAAMDAALLNKERELKNEQNSANTAWTQVDLLREENARNISDLEDEHRKALSKAANVAIPCAALSVAPSPECPKRSEDVGTVQVPVDSPLGAYLEHIQPGAFVRVGDVFVVPGAAHAKAVSSLFSA
jgi:hypothetical protein